VIEGEELRKAAPGRTTGRRAKIGNVQSPSKYQAGENQKHSVVIAWVRDGGTDSWGRLKRLSPEGRMTPTLKIRSGAETARKKSLTKEHWDGAL